MSTQLPATPDPGLEAPSTIPPAPPSAEHAYHLSIRTNYPDIAKLVQYGRYAEMITACENLEISVPDDTHPTRLLVNVPLVLANLILDDIPAAHFALKRLPPALGSSPLPQALAALIVSIGERKYQDVHSRIAAVLFIAKDTSVVEPELGLLVESMASTLQSKLRSGVVDLLSRAYSSIPASVATVFLDLPPDRIATELPSWRYDVATSSYTPLTANPNARPLGKAATLSNFDDAVAGAVHIEGVL
ncbi:hypothetical protein FRB99_001155 [Tulasnella sp. 403]|nr:hypothetical protein FRB99_001155 [Tulasnella sp. 403]